MIQYLMIWNYKNGGTKQHVQFNLNFEKEKLYVYTCRNWEITPDCYSSGFLGGRMKGAFHILLYFLNSLKWIGVTIYLGKICIISER